MPNSQQLAERLSSPVQNSLRRQASKGVIWTTFQSLANRASGTIVFLVLARLLAPREFGLLAAAQVFIALSSSLSEAGLTRTLVQRPVLRANHLNAAFLVNLLAGAVLAAALIGFAPLISDLYDMPDLAPVLMVLALVPLLTGLSAVPESILRRELKFRTLALRGTTSVAIGSALGIVAALLGAGVWALVAQSVSQVALASVILWASVRWRPSVVTDRQSLNELLGFGLHVLGISLLNFLNRRSSEFLIGVFLGAVPLGLFAVAMRVQVMLLDMLVSNVQKVALPVFSRVSTDGPRLAAAYLRATMVTTILATPAFVAMTLLGPEIVPALFGSQWLRAGPLMAVLALSGPMQSLAYFNSSMMLAQGKSLMALRWTTANATANVLVFLATVHFGVMAVAIGFTARCYVMSPIGLWLVSRVSEVRFVDQLRSFVVPLVGSAAMLAVTLLAHLVPDRHQSTLWLLVTLALTLLAYAAVVAVMRRELLLAGIGRIRERLRGSRGASAPAKPVDDQQTS